jgi:heterodisulfide reductase subunit B
VKIGYFPGCSLHATAREFGESLHAIAPRLDLELCEIEDWSCCGATSAHVTQHLLSVALPARSLALAEEQGHAEVMAPCAACYSRLATARHEIGESSELADRVKGVIGRPDFANTVRVMSGVELLRGMLDTIRSQATTALGGKKVACYYGCLLVRPPAVAGWDDAEAPTAMEQVVTAAGATPVAWNRRLECCGGGLSIARTGSVIRLGRSILEDAQAAGAEMVVVACPMCHSNLDMRQQAMRRSGPPLPILFLTQLVGLALGVPAAALGLGRHFVSTDLVASSRPLLTVGGGDA